MSEARLIKRYSNRKLYDTKESNYITLEVIGQLVGSGEDVKVLDNASKEDITADTLLQVIFQREKAKGSHDLQALMNVLRTKPTESSDSVVQA